MKKNFLEKLQEEKFLDLYLVSLISADSLFTVEDCDESLEHLNDALRDIETANIDNKDFYKKMIIDGIEIVERDKQFFIEQNKTSDSNDE